MNRLFFGCLWIAGGKDEHGGDGQTAFEDAKSSHALSAEYAHSDRHDAPRLSAFVWKAYDPGLNKA